VVDDVESEIQTWNFLVLLLLLAPVLLFVAAAFLVPKGEADATVNLRECFYENRLEFFVVCAAYTALIVTENWLLSGQVPPMPTISLSAVWFGLLCASAFVKNERYHVAVVILFALSFLVFIIVFELRLASSEAAGALKSSEKAFRELLASYLFISDNVSTPKHE
jgi:uncharacterized protein YpmS